MIKTLQQALKMDREKFKVPRSVQQAIPIQRIWPDGVFQSGTKFSKSFRFSDINYAIASKEDKTEMFLDYSELLNALDSGASAKITLNNRRINKEEFEASLLLPMKEDGLDTYRKEYNEMLLSKVSGTNNSIYQERYLTVSVHKKNIDEARTYFARVGTDIITHLSKLSSIGEELDAEQRLQIFRDFFQADQPQCFPFDMKAFAKRGSSFKDWICPQSMEFSKDCFKINERYGRVLYMQDYASYVKDDMISELCDLSRDLMLSIDILPVPTDEAVREIQNRLLGVETNVTNWQRRQNANNNFSAIVPYDMELQRKETKEMLDDLTTRDQRMMFGIIAYDIRELGEQLMPLGMLVTLDSIFNRVIQNWKKGKTTWIFADEFYLLFRYQYSADFFYRLYKRIRKYQGFVTGLTQNVEELLKSDTARLMLANSEFLILLNQATTDRDELASLLNISENQLSYITNVGAGKGLIRCSGNLVPFENSFPKNTKLYRLMTTKPGEC